MEHIYLNDLLGIDKESDDFLWGKITLSTGHLNEWLTIDGDDEQEKIGPHFSFWAKNGRGQILHENQFVVATVQLDSTDTWLLVFVGRVTKVNFGKPCERVAIEKYRKWFGRVIFHLDKKAQGYNFRLSKFLDRCKVIKVLDKPYGGKPFPGYMNLCEKMRDLMNYIGNTNLGEDWKKALQAVKAVYCLTDRKAGKVYIGSAYGDRGCLYKRWDDYFQTMHGGNKELKELKQKHDEEYFLDNFYFSILETLPANALDQEVIDRESHWKDVFAPRAFGYNSN